MIIYILHIYIDIYIDIYIKFTNWWSVTLMSLPPHPHLPVHTKTNAWPDDEVLIQSSILLNFDNSGKLNLKMDFQIFPFLLSTRWQSIIRRDVILGIGFGKEMQKIISH